MSADTLKLPPPGVARVQFLVAAALASVGEVSRDVEHHTDSAIYDLGVALDDHASALRAAVEQDEDDARSRRANAWDDYCCAQAEQRALDIEAGLPA